MSKKYLKRNVYDLLLAWKNRANHGTLEVNGARQVGKTFIVNKFADEQYQHKIYISLSDLSGDLFLSAYKRLWDDMDSGRIKVKNPVYELIKRYEPDFIDSKETVVIIDEIQESAEIYNRIREFTRNLECDFIITGSYLGRILDKSFKYSAGDIDSIEVNTLDFEEFLFAVDKHSLYQELDLFGNSCRTVYEELEQYYKIYCEIGGYPSVVLSYLDTGSVQESRAEIPRIIQLFTSESKRYFQDILDDAVYDNIFCSIARTLAKEKKGLDKDSFSEELQNLVVKDYSSNISKATINRSMDWLYSSGIIAFAGKITECNILDFKAKQRRYFMDIGLANHFLTMIGLGKEQRNGLISENFVFLNLRRRINYPPEIALETPAFAVYRGGELDYFVQTIETEKTYAIEVKSGKNSSKTINTVLDSKKVDYVLYAKGNTLGGTNGNIYTIPIYGIGKFRFR